jgi:hypothetical protein
MNYRALLVSAAFALVSAVPAATQTFSNPVRIPTLQDPVSVYSADLNGDGRPDLLYETGNFNSTPGAIHTLLAQASGGYIAGPTLTLPLNVGQCRPADVNNDGEQDLVCVDTLDSCDAQIATFLGNGDGSFQNPIYSGMMQSWCIMSNFYPELYAPADVNSDGFPDLIVGDTYNFQFYVLIGDGAGHFTLKSKNLTNGVNGAVLYATDLNGDGKPDLVSSVGPLVYLGNGDGTFGSEQSDGGYGACILDDIESDGRPDAVCVGYLAQGGNYEGTNELAILHNNADGTFNPTPIASQTFGNPQGGDAALWAPTAVVDLNGDGIPDILGFSSDGISVLQGASNLKFGPPVHYAVGNFGYIGGPATSQVVDLNGDGIPDIVATGASGLYISYGKKDGSFAAPPVYPVASVLGSVTVADFNGDGIPDIAATGDQSIELSLGKGDGTFATPIALPAGNTSFVGGTANTNFGFNIAHGDFRGIGRQDILAVGMPSTYEYYPYILFNNGDGTFSAPQVVPGFNIVFANLENFVIADFNGDHRDDVLTTTTYPVTAQVALSNGDGTFNMVTTVLPNVGFAMIPFPAVADFNKDGKPDLVYVAGANVNVLQGNGDGSFNTNAVVLPIPPYLGQTASYKPLGVTTGDFDGDGNQDIAVVALVGPWDFPPSPLTNIATAVYVYYGNGDGTFSAPVIAASSTAVYDTVYAADLNKDGRDDLILENTGTEMTGWPVPGNSVGVFLSEPGRLFGPESVYEVGVRGVGAFVADENRDGYPDLLISNSSYWDYGYQTPSFSNSVTELLNLGPEANSGLQQSTTILTASSESFVAGTSIMFTATVSGSTSSASPPGGSVRFADQTGLESMVPLVSSGVDSATATFTTSSIGPGSDKMSAAYLGDGVFAPSFATLPLTVTGLPDTVSLTLTPTLFDTGPGATMAVTVANPAGSTAATPTGYIEFYDGASVLGGPNTLSGGAVSFGYPLPGLGLHTVKAWYSGDLIHVSGSASAVIDNQGTPNVYVSPPSTTATTAESAMFTVTVDGGNGNPAPTGSVVLSGDGFTSSAATLVSGSASIAVPAGALPLGDHSLTATYTPDATSASVYLSASGSADLDVIPVPAGFTVAGTAVSVAPGATVGNTSAVTLTPSGGFTGAISLSCSIGPLAASDPATCSIPSSATISGSSAQTVTLTVTTTGPSSALNRRRELFGPIGGTAFACVLLLGMPGRRRKWLAALGMVLLLLVAGGAVSCGGGGTSGGGGDAGTTPGNYTITVTGTAGNITETGTIALTVQ